MSDSVMSVTPSTLLDAISRAVVATDPGGTIVYWNRAATQLYGWAPDEVLGRNVVDVLVPEPMTAQAGAIMAGARLGHEWSGDFWARHKDGRSLRVAVVDRAVLDDQGRVVAIVGESEDVSVQRGLEAELGASRDEQHLALAAGRLGILRWDRDTGRVSLDATAESLLGLQPHEFDGTYEAWADQLHPEDRERVLAKLDQAVETQGAYDLEYRVLWPDGSVRWLQGRGQVTLDDDGVVNGRIGCMADITERHRDEDDRARLLVAERRARSEAETSALRLRSLQAVTMALIRSVDLQAVARAVLGEGVSALGGRTGSICLVGADGVTVEIVHEVGYRDDVKQQWHSFPLNADLPASEAIRTGEIVLLKGPDDFIRRYPKFRGTPMVGDLSFAVVPLLDEDGSAFGAMVVGFREERDFNEGDQRVLAALAAQCSTALRRAALHEEAREAALAERQARLAAERAQDRLAFLAEASTALACAALDLDATLARVVALAVPRLADWCAIHLVEERGGVRLMAVDHVDPEQIEVARRLGAMVDVHAPMGVGAVCRAGTPEFHPEVTDEVLLRLARDEDHLDLLRQGRLHAMTILPLRTPDRILGALSLVSQTPGALDVDDLQLAEQLAVRASTAIDNARLFAERTRVARSLQASLLPPGLPAIPGLQLGARYAPAGEGIEVGGDFYDAFAVDGGRWVLVVGDVRGKGVDAAAVTGLARHTIRSIAMSETRPSAILAHLNRVLVAAEADRITAADAGEALVWELTEPRFCTVALAVVRPLDAGAALIVCSGGHPLPLVARAGGTVETVGRAGTLLGATPDVHLHDAEVLLGPGDALVCFTDGIVERHEGRMFFDEDGIAASLSGMADADADADAIADRIETQAREFVDDTPHDDMAVLVLRVPR